MRTRVQVYLDKSVYAALCDFARQEYRDPRAQAALLIRQRLEELGLLPADPAPAQAEAQPQEAARVEAAQPA
jgi:hypothetical protein